MSPKFFSALEAQKKIGTIVQTKSACAGLPPGTRGRVSDASQSLDGAFVIVSWDTGEIRGSQRWPMHHSFSKEGYHLYLTEME